MNNENKYLIKTIYDELCFRDSSYKGLKNFQNRFKTLYEGWRQQGLRHNTHSRFFYTNAWKRGWLTAADWLSLRNYILQ